MATTSKIDAEHDQIVTVAGELGLRPAQLTAVARLLAEGATVPFIARYRKEMTDSLDEVQIAAVRDRLARLAELEKRREAICRSLEERALLTDELAGDLGAAASLAALEDLYLPFRPKRRTRATIARERGLEPLASRLFAQDPADRFDPIEAAAAFVDPQAGVASVDDALQGARDIMAEWVSEDAEIRAAMRRLYDRRALLVAKVARGKSEEAAKFRDYFDWNEGAAAAPSHRVLALFRGDAEGMLQVRLAPPEEEALALLESRFARARGPVGGGPTRDRAPAAVVQQVREAVTDGYRRLLGPSMETEARAALKARADEEAIGVFAQNLRELLLSPPLGQRVILAIDPGFRTGCKVVVLDPQGKLLHNETVQPHQSERARREAGERIRGLVTGYQVEAVAVGNGTAGRETEAFIRELDLSADVALVMVNESGASIYSASEVAREELPDQDVTVRGAVSIGRRLADPLAELVKIDPKSIGVGQYQHDVDQQALRAGLDDVVMSAVNSVGVEVNTASRQLLTYVSGVGSQLAANIVAHRDEQGPFHSRKELKKVPRLGAKAFEQAAGFLRIRDGEDPLDAGAVHPESYRVVDAMARDLGVGVRDLMTSADLRGRIELSRYVDERVGLPTLRDILAELAKPGRDPRGIYEPFQFAPGIEKLGDLEPGMRLPGIVTNVTAFGAFVDVGVHQDGLVHISQLADRFVHDPHTVVKVQQRVMVTVMGVDHERRRISLSLKGRRDADHKEAGRVP
jgi:uncharacterized protein